MRLRSLMLLPLFALLGVPAFSARTPAVSTPEGDSLVVLPTPVTKPSRLSWSKTLEVREWVHIGFQGGLALLAIMGIAFSRCGEADTRTEKAGTLLLYVGFLGNCVSYVIGLIHNYLARRRGMPIALEGQFPEGIWREVEAAVTLLAPLLLALLVGSGDKSKASNGGSSSVDDSGSDSSDSNQGGESPFLLPSIIVLLVVPIVSITFSVVRMVQIKAWEQKEGVAGAAASHEERVDAPPSAGRA